jgi:prepilin-type N-terminal cleavage/methylation domain-containing protein
MKMNRKTNAGYSLVEVLVALAIFGIVIVVAVGALVTILDLNRGARAQKSAINNLHSTLESMTRAIRDGSSYYCDSNATPDGYNFAILGENPCPSNANIFIFTASNGERTAYFLSETTPGQIKRVVDDGPRVGMTAGDVVIEDLTFRTIDYTLLTTDQANVFITMRARVGASDPQTEATLTLQTTVSGRLQAQGGSSGGTNESTIPFCPFGPLTGRQIIDFEAEKTSPVSLLARKDMTHPRSTETYILDSSTNRDPILAGVYNVRFASWDEHCPPGDPFCRCGDYPQTGEWDCPEDQGHAQPAEEVVVELYSGGALIGGGTSMNQYSIRSYTEDVPWDVNVHETNLGQINTLGNTIDKIRIVHCHVDASYVVPGAPLCGDGTSPLNHAESVVAACAAFDRVGGGGVIIEEF